MSATFREYLKKVGSGTHTSKDLTRQEAQDAMRLMLEATATPAQIGAFFIAHRIKRPTGAELAGMLDAYESLGPTFPSLQWAEPFQRKPLVLSAPYDGRSRTAPIGILTALILATAGCPVLLHGGDRLPTKYGTPLIEIWNGLGVFWQKLTWGGLQQVLESVGIGFAHLPACFPLAQQLVPYRDQIGKRPPVATIELFWSPFSPRDATVVVGYVHPPTEGFAIDTFHLRGTEHYITVKGLEGSCDLPRDRSCIIGLHNHTEQKELTRLVLHPRDYDLAETDVPLPPVEDLVMAHQDVLEGNSSALMRSTVWNGGFYLWQTGCCPTMSAGLEMAEKVLKNGEAAQTLEKLQQAIATCSAAKTSQD